MRMHHNFREEDFLGLLKPVAMKAIVATPQQFEKVVLERYMIRPAAPNLSYVLLYFFGGLGFKHIWTGV